MLIQPIILKILFILSSSPYKTSPHAPPSYAPAFEIRARGLAGVVPGDRLLPGRLRAVHDVSAALFPTLLRTTGAGFCYNIGRIAAAFRTVFFGLFSHIGDHRMALFYASFLFLPAAECAFLMPKARD
jgi:hypothetical protein